MLRVLREENGVLCIATFLSANIDPDDKKRVLMMPLAVMGARDVIYGITFKDERAAEEFVKLLYSEGKASEIAIEDAIEAKGFLKLGKIDK